MGKLSGTVLILAGVGLAGYTLSSQHDAGTKIATAHHSTDAGTPAAPGPVEPVAAPATAAAPAESVPAASETSQLPTPPAPPTPGALPASASPPALFPPPPAPPSRLLPPGTPPAVGLAEAPPRVPIGEDKVAAGPPLDRPALIREIQRELRRVGCYGGQVNGVWTPSVRQAMKALTDRVNASLPVDQPDPVLLAMAQSQTPETCAASCPAGQARSADGRCLPSALVAGAGKRPARAAPVPATGSNSVAQPGPVAPAPPDAAPLDGRMALAGPPPGAPPQARTPSRRTAKTTPPHAKVAQWPRSANARPRERQRAAQRSFFGFPGFPGWALPFSMP